MAQNRAPEVVVEAKARFYRSTKYHVTIRGISYGRCKKYWNDFEELYDSLEQSYGEKLADIPFPTYITRRDKSKKEAVEGNRKNLQTLLTRLLQQPEISRTEAVVVFLQLTDFVNEDDRQEHAPPACANEALRNRPGPTPATVKPIYHNTALDEADAAIDEESPGLDESMNRDSGAGGAEQASKAALSGKPVPTESSNTVWIGR